MPVFIVLGSGGYAHPPLNTFLIPLGVCKSNFVSREIRNEYETKEFPILINLCESKYKQNWISIGKSKKSIIPTWSNINSNSIPQIKGDN